MNSKQRHLALRRAFREIEAHARAECTRLELDPEKWSTMTLDYSAVRKQQTRTQNFRCKSRNNSDVSGAKNVLGASK